MTRPIRIALHIQPQHAEFSEVRAAVVRGEEMGVDAIFTFDHFFPIFGDPDGKIFECWTTLASWAEVTDRVELGTLVTSVGHRNPDLLAHMARTVDHASGGRLVLGIGSGHTERDYAQYGYGVGTPGSRLADLQDALPRIKRRLAESNPPPVRDVPILIGGGGERKTLRIAAEFADIWHTYGPPEVIERKNRVLDEHCSNVGRDPGAIERAWGTRLGENTEHRDAIVDAGVSLITLSFGHGGPVRYDLAPVADWLAWRDEVNAGSGR